MAVARLERDGGSGGGGDGGSDDRARQSRVGMAAAGVGWKLQSLAKDRRIRALEAQIAKERSQSEKMRRFGSIYLFVVVVWLLSHHCGRRRVRSIAVLWVLARGS